jgi:hypothetical protein
MSIKREKRKVMSTGAFNRITLTSLKVCEPLLLQATCNSCTASSKETATVGERLSVSFAGWGKKPQKF